MQACDRHEGETRGGGPQTCTSLQDVFKEHMLSPESETSSTAEEVWNQLKTGLLRTTREVCAYSSAADKPRQWLQDSS